jgi:hypothetical protein
MTTTALVTNLAKAFRSQAIFPAHQDAAYTAATLIANAEQLPVAAEILAFRVRQLLTQIAEVDRALRNHNGLLTESVLDSMSAARRQTELKLNEASDCLIAVTLGTVARMESIARPDRPAIRDMILARY